MKNPDISLLENCLANTYDTHGILNANKIWYSSQDTMLAVARILVDECYLRTPDDVIYFFEKPWKCEGDMKEIIEENQGVTK